MDLSALSDQALVSGVIALVGSHRELTAKLVAHLSEIEERRLHLLAGYSSMFDFCQKKLGMSEGEAFRRILAARLGRRFPIVYDLLASGRVHLSTLQLLRDQLTDENHEELLTAVSGKGRREVQTLLAVWFPRPDRPSRISPRASIEPLSECRFRVELTASAELREKIERCCDLMSHANPSRDLAVVMERAIDLLLVDLEKKRLGATTGRGPKTRNSGIARRPVASGRVSTAVRREVFERDGSRCTFVSEDGRRCDASAFLELDHVHPRAVGGSNDVTNLRVRCRAHNQLWAEQTFGREKVQRLRQKKSNSNASACRHEDGRRQGEEQSLTPERRKLFEKVRLALTTMGFRGAEARRAVAEVSKMHDLGTDLDLERVFREALRWATAA